MDRKKLWKTEAENHYARAMVRQGKGNFEGAKSDGKRAIELYKRLEIRTLEDAAPTRMQVRGVCLPDIMHEGVVAARLGIDYAR